MVTIQPFPDNRSDLRTLTMCGVGRAHAIAVLLAPRGGKRHQRLMLLSGSVLERYEVRSCPCLASQIRRSWRENGIAVERGGELVLQEDRRFNTPGLAACVATGASKNGWDYFRSDGQSLNDLWWQEPSPLFFYHPASRMPPPFTRPGEVIQVPPLRPGMIGEREWILAQTATSQVVRLELPRRKKRPRERAKDDTFLQCREGKAVVYTYTPERTAELVPHQEVLIPEGSEYSIEAIEDTLLLMRRFVPR